MIVVIDENITIVMASFAKQRSQQLLSEIVHASVGRASIIVAIGSNATFQRFSS
jgi:hypothetical protein